MDGYNIVELTEQISIDSQRIKEGMTLKGMVFAVSGVNKDVGRLAIYLTLLYSLSYLKYKYY